MVMELIPGQKLLIRTRKPNLIVKCNARVNASQPQTDTSAVCMFFKTGAFHPDH